MAIRLATSQDMDELLDIYAQARAFMASYGNDSQWTDGYPSIKILNRDMELDRLYVYEIDDKIEGCFVFFIGKDPNYEDCRAHWLNDHEYGVIHRIASRRRVKNVAQDILNYCFEQISDIRIDTHEKNIPMQRFLKRNGFQCVGTIELLEIHEDRMAFHASR